MPCTVTSNGPDSCRLFPGAHASLHHPATFSITDLLHNHWGATYENVAVVSGGVVAVSCGFLNWLKKLTRCVAPILVLRPASCVPHRLDDHGAPGASTDGSERRGSRAAPAAQSPRWRVSKARRQTVAVTNSASSSACHVYPVRVAPLSFTGRPSFGRYVERLIQVCPSRWLPVLISPIFIREMYL